MNIRHEYSIDEILKHTLKSLELERKLATRLTELRLEEATVAKRIEAMKEHRLQLETLFN
jgi:hypothetical protein